MLASIQRRFGSLCSVLSIQISPIRTVQTPSIYMRGVRDVYKLRHTTILDHCSVDGPQAARIAYGNRPPPSMARVFLLLLSVVAALSAADNTDGWLEDGGGILNELAESADMMPTFHRRETAPFTLLKKLPTYEVRKYPATKWVCTSSKVEGFDLVTNGLAKQLFMKLFRYIRGANDKKMRMRMTTPVTSHFVRESRRQNLVTMCFYISAKHQQNPPKPIQTDVFIQNRAALQAIVAKRSGYPSGRDWEVMGIMLARDSYANGDLGYNLQSSYGVQYDPPFKFWRRRNELWYVKEV